MQRSRVWNTKIVERRLFRVCSMKGDYRTPMTQAFLSLSLSRLLLFLLLSPMIIHVRGARHDRQSILRNDTLPLPLFRSVDDDSTCQRVVSLFPAMETGRGRKKRSRTFCSYDFKFDGGFGFGVKMASDCLWKTRELGIRWIWDMEGLTIENTCWSLLIK